MLFLFGVGDLFGTTRNETGEEMRTGSMISSQISHQVRDSFHGLLSCWSQSSRIPSSTLPQLCWPFSAEPILANCLDNPALGGCLPALCEQRASVPLSQRWWEAVPRLPWHPVPAGSVLLLQASPCLGPGTGWDEFKTQITWSIWNLGLGTTTLSKKWKIAGSSPVAVNVADSSKCWAILEDAHRAYNNGAI